jgi:hypothetical protein
MYFKFKEVAFLKVCIERICEIGWYQPTVEIELFSAVLALDYVTPGPINSNICIRNSGFKMYISMIF